MKLYIKADTEKPLLDYIETEWSEIDNGIKFSIFDNAGDILFEEIFDYDDVDSDAIYDSAADMAIVVLSQKYKLSDKVVDTIKDQESNDYE